jgi:multiple sugar transport system permease protein
LPYLFVSPALIFILALAVAPAASTAVLAFFHVSLLDPPTRFSGLDNFRSLLTNPAIQQSLVNTGWYIFFGTVLATMVATLMALTLRQPFRGRSVVLALVIVPWALPGVVEGIIWSWIYDPTYGVLNGVLHGLHLIGDYQTWLGENKIQTIALISLVQVWQIVPLSTLLILASMQQIPESLYEAARIDGATRWQMVRRITLPLARPGIAVAVVQAVIATLNMFDQAYVLNGAASTAAPLMLQTYLVTFQNFDFGQGYALSLFCTVATVLVAGVVVRVVYRKVEY